jgi:hypothetical protein
VYLRDIVCFRYVGGNSWYKDDKSDDNRYVGMETYAVGKQVSQHSGMTNLQKSEFPRNVIHF